MDLEEYSDDRHDEGVALLSPPRSEHRSGRNAAAVEKIERPSLKVSLLRLVQWYPDTLSREERWLLLKLDVVLLVYVCCSYFTKSLDKASVTNGYVSGMKEDLGMGGDDLAYAKSVFNAGYVITMCVGTVLVSRPWARFMLPSLELVWGALTMLSAWVTTPNQLYATRFLTGLAEGPSFTVIVYIIGSWYMRDELYRRVMVFSMSSALGSMFSGYFQAAAYSKLSGVAGLAGWQWGFLVDGLVTLPIALFGFLLFPGTPHQATKTFWLSADEIELAHRRLHRNGTTAPRALNLATVKRVLSRWHIYIFATLWILLNIVALPDGLGFTLWLESQPRSRYPISAVNNYPTIGNALGVVLQWIFAGLADAYSPYPTFVIVQITFVVIYASLTLWDIPDAWRWVCFLLINFDGTDQALFSGWINHVCRHDAEERAIVIGVSDALSQAVTIWTNIVLFPTSQAPEFHRGYMACTVSALLMLGIGVPTYLLEARDEEQLKEQRDTIDMP